MAAVDAEREITTDMDSLLGPMRVLDLSSGTADAVSRILADLGADVLKIEPPQGSPARSAFPRLAGTSIAFALHNANKRASILDPAEPADRIRFLDLAAGADVIIDSGRPGLAAAFGTSCAELAERFEHVVALSVTDFGSCGPRARWRATDAVLYALSSALSRSGPPTGPPVLPPDGIASATAAVQAAWAVLVAYYQRLRIGRGDHIDFSRLDAVVLALDPPFGSHGQAAAATAAQTWRGRPRNQDAYPVIACKDGYVRLAVMAPRQWRGLRAWMGEPDQYQDPKYDNIIERVNGWRDIAARLAKLFADRTMDELVTSGQQRGVPIAAVLDPGAVTSEAHFATVGAMTTTELVPGVRTPVPAGYFTVDGRRRGFRTPATGLGADPPTWICPPVSPDPHIRRDELPFTGLRIVDLGIIVAGGELSRLFGDLGAEVIKVESTIHPDGLRQGRPGQLLGESFAWTHRNKLGLGLELRTEAGAEVFARLVRTADAVFANFKPGTLAGLGFPYDKLRELNPGIVVTESSAFGDTGPWRARLGYGPLVRASTGVTHLWASPHTPTDDRHPFFDATTVFPDHVVGRIAAIAALAALIRRDRTGTGARIHISQAEAGINQLDTAFVTRNVAPAYRDRVELGGACHGVYPCHGDDEWCVISVTCDNDREAAAAVMGPAEQWSAWTAARTPLQAATELQQAGVCAAPMNRRSDVLDDPQLQTRGLYRQMAHPLIEHLLPAESGPAPFGRIAEARMQPAPLPGEHTRQICSRVIGLDDTTTNQLIADGVLFTATERTAP